MFDLPDTFKEDNEDYVVVNAMKNFIRCRPHIRGRLSDNRRGLINTIITYANESEKNAEETLTWVDSVVREGIKDLYIKEITEESKEIIKDVDQVYSAIQNELQKVNSNHLCGNFYSDEIKLVNFRVEDQGSLIYTFYLCQMVYIFDGKHDEKKRLYPICVDIYPDEGLVIGRGKPRQNMYKYNKDGFDAKNTQKVVPESRIFYAMQYIMNLLGIQCKNVDEIGRRFKHCLYKLLETYTNTPQEIIELMNNSKDEINSVIDTVADKICTKGNKGDIKFDILNLVEKYFSITYEDKSIFTKGRDAYPLRILATDEEESKVDQKSAKEHPLQSKALFFDNKKMMQKNQICDGIVFKFKRKGHKEYGDELKVRISTKNNYCHMKFFEYTEEVDIQNVLQLFINA